MRGDIVLHGFVLTAEEWVAMDATARAQLLRVALRRDEPWLAAAPPAPAPRPRRELTDDDIYEAYELSAVPA
ncbi:MAG: hypothetical protein IPL61_01305 [Myxococcales bacterium]|nr:hypothetical protein [Myxococcales bacterium]